jgi:hypothetical protein
MSRGYRSIIVAAFGWLILCAQHPNPTAKAEQAQADSRVGDALVNIATTYNQEAKRAQRLPDAPPCGPAQYQSNDDLCAQWKAADAAEKAAWWAAFAGWFGGLSFLGVLAAIALAFHSNWIARDTAKRQLRAYLGIERVFAEMTDDGMRITVKLKNFGETPASQANLQMRTRGKYISQSLMEYPIGIVDPGFHEKKSIHPIASTESANVSYSMGVDVVIFYEDAFGVKWERQERYVFIGNFIFGDSNDLDCVGSHSKERRLNKGDTAPVLQLET